MEDETIDWKAKCAELQIELDRMKEAEKQAKEYSQKEDAYKDLLHRAGVNPRYVDKVAKASRPTIEKLKVADGKVCDSDIHLLKIREEWEGFIPKKTK